MAEERILGLLKCSMEQLATDPELQAGAKSDPDSIALGALTGHSQPFEELLKKNSLGRRFFITASGRPGITEVEQRDDHETNEADSPVPSFDNAMGDPLGHIMFSQFNTYLQQHDPDIAEVAANAIRGELSGQAPPGVRASDLVVACVNGFQPYILGTENAHAVDKNVAGNLLAESTYTYVGSCYVHGIMNGECFKSRKWIGREVFRIDVELVDIVIV